MISRKKELDLCVPPLPDLDSLGEHAVSHKGLDCYLDSLFDPVLSYGDAVGMGACADHRHSVHTLSRTRLQGDSLGHGVVCLIWVSAGDPAKDEGVLLAGELPG